MGRSLQCLQCGTIGHPAARCQFTDAQLKGPGAIEVTEAELQDVEDLAKPFLSPEEMREIASKRLQLQRAADEAAQAAVTPAAVGTAPPRPPPTVEPQLHGVSIPPVYTAIPTHVGSSDPKPKPRPEQPWRTRPLRSGRRLWPSRKPPVPTGSLSSGGFHVLQDTEPELEQKSAGSAQATSTDGVTGDLPITPEPHPTMNLDAAQASPLLSSEDRVRQQDSKVRGKAPVISGPTLLAKQRLERKTCVRLVKQ